MDSLTSVAGFLNKAFGIFTATTHVAALSVRIVDEAARTRLAIYDLQQGELSCTRAAAEVIASATLIAADACSLAISLRGLKYQLSPETPKKPYWEELIEKGDIPKGTDPNRAAWNAFQRNREFCENAVNKHLPILVLRLAATVFNVIRDEQRIEPFFSIYKKEDLYFKASKFRLLVHGTECILLLHAMPSYPDREDPHSFARNFSVDGLPPLHIESSLARTTLSIINVADLYFTLSSPLKIDYKISEMDYL